MWLISVIIILFQVVRKVKQYVLIIRALNYSVGLQDFTIAIFCNFKLIFNITEALNSTVDFVQAAVCALSSDHNGISIINKYTCMLR